jgi:hypothetical protein
LTFGRLRVTITIGVAGAATTTLVAVEVEVVLTLLVLKSFNIGLDEFKSGVGEVSSRENVAEHVDSVFGAVKENGDRLEVLDGEAKLEIGGPKGHHVVTALGVGEVEAQVRHTWPKELILAHPKGGGDHSDLSPGRFGVWQQNGEHQVNVDPLMVVRSASFTALDAPCRSIIGGFGSATAPKEVDSVLCGPGREETAGGLSPLGREQARLEETIS